MTQIPPHLVQRYKALRLDALLSSPTSFVSNHKHEQAFTDTEWAERITDPSRHHMICKKIGPTNDDASDIQSVDSSFGEGEWVGMFTFLGPLTKEEYDFQGRIGPPLGEDADETRWHLFGLYIKAEDRCKDAAIVTHEAILEYLRNSTEEILETALDARTGLEKRKRARVAGSKPSQGSLLTALYASLGGYDIGWAERAEALRISGNAELSSRRKNEGDMGPVLIMEKVVDC